LLAKAGENTPECKQLFASLNANVQVLVDHANVGKSLWSKLHDLDIRLAAIQDPDKINKVQMSDRREC
jgi:hypothetical protein